MNNSKIEKENEQSEFSNHEEEVSAPGAVCARRAMLEQLL